jgi:hypothetical protein
MRLEDKFNYFYQDGHWVRLDERGGEESFWGTLLDLLALVIVLVFFVVVALLLGPEYAARAYGF